MWKIFASGSNAGGREQRLLSLEALDAFALDALSRRLFEHALATVREQGGCRLTTSFLLFSLVQLGDEASPDPLCAWFRHLVLEADPDSYHGVMGAYFGWYRGSCRRDGENAGERLGMTPYIGFVLKQAQDFARRAGAEGRVAPEHLLAALLSHDPGPDQVQPGFQYILTMTRPGLAPVVRAFVQWLGTAHGGRPAWCPEFRAAAD